MNNLIAKEYPLSKTGKFFLFLSYVFSFLILIIGSYSYLNLPQKVAVHFNLQGNPDRYGHKVEILFVTLILFILAILFSLFVQKRYYLFKNYPYLLNIPAFYLYAQKLDDERQSFWIARYFDFLAIVMFLVNFMFLVIEIFICLGAFKGKLPKSFNYFLLPYVIFVLIFVFGYLFALYKKIKKEAEKI